MAVDRRRIHAGIVGVLQHVGEILYGRRLVHEALILLNADEAHRLDLDAGEILLELGGDRVHAVKRPAHIPDQLALFLGGLVEGRLVRRSGNCCASAPPACISASAPPARSVRARRKRGAGTPPAPTDERLGSEEFGITR